MPALVIGSRGSALALWQSRWVAARLAGHGFDVRIETIQTTGDRVQNVSLSKVGTKGLFTKEIEEALLRGDVDLAVHSLKDMPTELPDGLTLTAIPVREDARDVLAGARLHDLAPGARVGTSSLRREAQLRALRPDLLFEAIRGNVDTRLRKQAEGQFDAIVLAAAGLKRLGLVSRITEYLEIDTVCPAVGQGALAIEARIGDDASAILDDAETHCRISAERAVLAALGGGCQVPFGAHAVLNGETLDLLAVAASPDGASVVRVRDSGSASDPEQLGLRVADRLLKAGAREILEQVYG